MPPLPKIFHSSIYLDQVRRMRDYLSPPHSSDVWIGAVVSYGIEKPCGGQRGQGELAIETRTRLGKIRLGLDRMNPCIRDPSSISRFDESAPPVGCRTRTRHLARRRYISLYFTFLPFTPLLSSALPSSSWSLVLVTTAYSHLFQNISFPLSPVANSSRPNEISLHHLFLVVVFTRVRPGIPGAPLHSRFHTVPCRQISSPCILILTIDVTHLSPPSLRAPRSSPG